MIHIEPLPKVQGNYRSVPFLQFVFPVNTPEEHADMERSMLRAVNGEWELAGETRVTRTVYSRELDEDGQPIIKREETVIYTLRPVRQRRGIV